MRKLGFFFHLIRGQFCCNIWHQSRTGTRPFSQICSHNQIFFFFPEILPIYCEYYTTFAYVSCGNWFTRGANRPFCTVLLLFGGSNILFNPCANKMFLREKRHFLTMKIRLFFYFRYREPSHFCWDIYAKTIKNSTKDKIPRLNESNESITWSQKSKKSLNCK